MQIFVKVLGGDYDPVSLDVTSTTTISELKYMIETRLGINPSMQRLIFAGKALADDHTIYDYNLQHNNTIILVFALRGD